MVERGTPWNVFEEHEDEDKVKEVIDNCGNHLSIKAVKG